MAQYQRLSNDYVPEAEGPLISQRQPCQNITAEYAQADAIYIQKTTALALKFTSYRTVRGDGNCGWRALAFGYFEALIQSSHPSGPAAEITRLISMNNLLNTVGYQQTIYEDFVEETLHLLKQIANSPPNQDSDAALLTSFNDASVGSAIIMHFRLISGAWMKTHRESFIPFIESMNVDQYCETHIEPYAVEMDNIGLQACFEAILRPAGVTLKVLYLDRSPGEQVNELSWQSESPDSSSTYGGTPTVRLLYRPGHYDILYKPEDIPALPTAVTNPQINFLSEHPVYTPSSNTCYVPHQGLDMNHFFLPGFASAGVSPLSFSPNTFSAAPLYSPSSLPMSSPSTEAYGMSYSAPPPKIHPTPPPPLLPGISSTGGFRPSIYQFSLKERKAAQAQTEPCQTEAMKQAGESPAHFRNKKFQPQMWEPGAEYNVSRSSSESNRRRSS